MKVVSVISKLVPEGWNWYLLKLFDVSTVITYLNIGTGKACAGHAKVMEPAVAVLKLFESSIVGNFGLTPPTGSVHHSKHSYLT